MQVVEFVWDLPHECLIGLDRRAENCLCARIVFNRRRPQSEPGASELFVLFGETAALSFIYPIMEGV